MTEDGQQNNVKYGIEVMPSCALRQDQVKNVTVRRMHGKYGTRDTRYRLSMHLILIRRRQRAKEFDPTEENVLGGHPTRRFGRASEQLEEEEEVAT